MTSSRSLPPVVSQEETVRVAGECGIVFQGLRRFWCTQRAGTPCHSHHDAQEPLNCTRPRRSAFDSGSIKHLRADRSDRPKGVLWLSDAGAGDGTRTRKGFPPAVFKTAAFAFSPLRRSRLYYSKFFAHRVQDHATVVPVDKHLHTNPRSRHYALATTPTHRVRPAHSRSQPVCRVLTPAIPEYRGRGRAGHAN